MVDIYTGQPQRTRALGNLALGQGMQGGPVYHPLQALGQLAQTAAGVYLSRKADQQEQQRQEQAQSALLGLLQGAPQTATAGATPMSMSGGTPGQPSLMALVSAAQQFPEELGGVLNPMIAARLKGPKTFTGVAAPGSQVFQGGEVVATVPPRPTQEKLVEIADETSPTGTRFVVQSEAIGQPGRPRQEFRFETITGPDGETRTVMVRGRPGAAGATEQVSKPTRNKLEQGISTAAAQLDRLAQIRENLDTRFLNLPEQFKQGGRAMLERLGVELSPESQRDLQAYTRFASSTRRNLNRILNELSGAAISPAEAKRLMAELPTTDDSPTQFVAKIDDAERAIQAAIARNQQLLESGVMALEFDRDGNITNAPSLDNFMEIPEERGAVEAGMGEMPQAPGAGFAATAVNPETGEIVVWNGSEWVPQ